jgi:hypothetical protein
MAQLYSEIVGFAPDWLERFEGHRLGIGMSSTGERETTLNEVRRQ